MNDVELGFRPMLRNPGCGVTTIQSISRRKRRARGQLQVFELFLRQSGLLEDRSKGPRRHVSRVHGNIRLPSVGMPQYNVRAGLSANDEPSFLQASQNFTRLVGHPPKVPTSRKNALRATAPFHDSPVSQQPTDGADREQLRALLQSPIHESSIPVRGYERSNTLRGIRGSQHARAILRSSYTASVAPCWSRCKAEEPPLQVHTPQSETTEL